MNIRISRRFISITIVLVIALVVLILALLKPWSNPLSADDLLERVKVMPSSTGIKTYRIDDSTREIIDGNETVVNTQVSYSSPDSVHYLRSTQDSTTEIISLGDICYQKQTGITPEPGFVVSIVSVSDTPIETALLEIVTNLSTAERLPDEEVNSTPCYYIRGNYWPLSVEELLEHVRNGNSEKEDEIQAILENIRQGDVITVDIWINKNNYNLAKIQMDSSHQSGNRQSYLATTYYDFGQPMNITAPLDENSNLLPGWNIVNDCDHSL